MTARQPFVLGLTGSIGMGKSTVAGMLRALDIPVFDADAAVHVLQGPGGVLLAPIEAEFPGSTGANGVDRARLGAMVFGNPAALARLEAIVHPEVHRLRADFLREYAEAPLIVFDIPLLYEKGRDPRIDAIAVVSAPAKAQRERVMARPGMTHEKFDRILGLQVPDAQKRQLADYVIDTGVSLADTQAQVEELVRRLAG